MKKYAILIALVAIILPTFNTAYAKKTDNDRLKVMSFNIRYGEAEDGTNSWMYRYPFTAMMLTDQKPDVIGIQEGLNYQLNYLQEYVKPYKYVGKPREDGKKKGEYTAIMYNPKTVALSKWGVFWLSETPEVPSMGWDAACSRTATWALMKDKKSGRKFYFVNTHLDHVGPIAQEKGMALILERLAEINKEGLPVILTGDLNVSQDARALNELNEKMVSCRKNAYKSDNGITYNAWGKAKEQSQIDHIYYKGFDHCHEFSVLTKKYEGRSYISDHFPVIAIMVF